MSAAEGASEASSPEQANELAVRANERTDERVAQYFSLYSWLFWPTVRQLTADGGVISLGKKVEGDVHQITICYVFDPV